jgi:hypothetical protein
MRRSRARSPQGILGTRRGLAAPVSLLLILFSLTLVSTITYSYALGVIGSRKQDLKLVAAEEKMLDMESAISAVVWSPGSIRTLAFSNYDGQLRVEPDANHLLLNATMDGSNHTLFDSDTGRFIYELPNTVVGHYGRWIRGDDRPIVNQSASYQAQMSVEVGDEHEELRARYRPLASSSVGDLISDRRINHVRIYVVNLNSSASIESGEEFHVKVESENVTTQVRSYDLDADVTSINLKAVLDGAERTITVPLTVGASGSTVRIEVVIGYVKIQGVEI